MLGIQEVRSGKRRLQGQRIGSMRGLPRSGKSLREGGRTLCGGKVQGSFAMKLANCMKCDYYLSPYYDKQYRG